MVIGDIFYIKTKTGSYGYRIIGKDIQDVTSEKKGYLGITLNEPEELKFWSYPQFHTLKARGIILI